MNSAKARTLESFQPRDIFFSHTKQAQVQGKPVELILRQFVAVKRRITNCSRRIHIANISELM